MRMQQTLGLKYIERGNFLSQNLGTFRKLFFMSCTSCPFILAPVNLLLYSSEMQPNFYPHMSASVV
jgi:hypothetical protein